MDRTLLVTGGAGYIGSHTALELVRLGARVIVADDLSNGSLKALDAVRRLSGRDVEFVEVDLAERSATESLFDKYPIDGVLHFAGLKAVGESVDHPLRYYRTNIGSTINLLEAMRSHDVFDLVFSSSATVYGDVKQVPISETASTGATNPYGRTKLMIEEICRDVATSDGRWRMTMLRYFNPVGAHDSGDLGEDPRGLPNNLVPFVMQVAVGRLERLEVFGADYDTPDGTGVRDYIHVVDLAKGHVAALDNLEPGWQAFNLGTGSGASVFEVIAAAQAVVGVDIPYSVVARRPGDVATSLADPSKANQELGWRADRNLQTMLTDAWRWQSKHPAGFEIPRKD